MHFRAAVWLALPLPFGKAAYGESKHTEGRVALPSSLPNLITTLWLACLPGPRQAHQPGNRNLRLPWGRVATLPWRILTFQLLPADWGMSHGAGFKADGFARDTLEGACDRLSVIMTGDILLVFLSLRT